MNTNRQEYTKDEWLALRSKTVGSSDAAVVCGVSSFGSPFERWARKRGMIEPLPPSRRMRAGHALEAEIERELANDFYLYDPGDFTTWHHPVDTWRTATPDRLALPAPDSDWQDAIAVVEMKTRHSRFANEGEPTEDMVIQVQHQMAVLDLPMAYIAVWYGLGSAFEVYEVPADHELQALIHDRECRFVDQLRSGIAPDVDEHEATLAAIRELYGTEDVDLERVELDADIWAWVEQRESATREIAVARRKRNEAEAHLLVALGDSPVGRVAGLGTIEWTTVQRKGYEVKPTSYRRLRIIKDKGRKEQ